jgi:putative colanic acid biosynthesis acetyltransferase WcaF
MNVNLIGGAILNYSFNNLITHIPIHFVRKGFLRLFNKKIHPSSVILMHTRILNFWKVIIEEGVVINQYCLLDCRINHVQIGRCTDIGPYTKIWTLGHDPNSETHALYGSNVIIGHHVWIASGVTILPGVHVANGTVVAASAVLHKSTEVNDVMAGNPAKLIRKRVNSLTYKLNYNPILD